MKLQLDAMIEKLKERQQKVSLLINYDDLDAPLDSGIEQAIDRLTKFIKETDQDDNPDKSVASDQSDDSDDDQECGAGPSDLGDLRPPAETPTPSQTRSNFMSEAEEMDKETPSITSRSSRLGRRRSVLITTVAVPATRPTPVLESSDIVIIPPLRAWQDKPFDITDIRKVIQELTSTDPPTIRSKHRSKITFQWAEKTLTIQELTQTPLVTNHVRKFFPVWGQTSSVATITLTSVSRSSTDKFQFTLPTTTFNTLATLSRYYD
jgi:hypothetical protein